MKAWFDFIADQNDQADLQYSQALCDLPDFSLLYVGGDDATDFLQNQLSNDIRKTSPELSQFSSLSTAKGRMIATFRVIAIDGGYILFLPSSNLTTLQQKLQTAVLRSKVVIADISDSFSRFSITLDETAEGPLDKLPPQVDQVYQSNSLIIVNIPAAQSRKRYLVLGNNADESIELWNQLSASLAINNSLHWRLQDIEAGIPNIYPETSEAFVLQMANLQLINGVSFKKGCYPGQEVVARMQYLGKLKRRMYLAQVASSISLAPGDELRSRDSEKTDGSGKVVDAVQLGDGRVAFLFVAQIEKADNHLLVLDKQPDANIELGTLPYSIAA
jgi:folate-binding protein YgfZ